MPEATIVAAKVFRPKPGKKRWTIVTPDETLYGAMPDIASRFREGGTYEIGYKVDHFAGKDYLVIEGAREVAAPTAAPATGSSGKYGAKDDETAERIFVCGALNASLGNPNFTPTELGGDALVAMVKRFRAVWAATFGAPQAQPTPAQKAPPEPKIDDMNDEIPF